ncbi:MAG: hypothetical protein H0X25_21670 [Acidobacteriales bacterium]|nr:hypothetical protein [Terriglobales bacterium]
MVDEKTKHEPGPEDIGFEHEDLRPRSVLGFLLMLGTACVIVYFVLLGVYSVLEKDFGRNQPPTNPLKAPEAPNTRMITPQEVEKFPEPRLETNERLEMHDFRLAEEKKLNGYSWVNQANGEVRIPIERAMQLVVQRGLPVKQGGEGAASTGKAVMEQAGSGRPSMPGTQYPGSPH